MHYYNECWTRAISASKPVPYDAYSKIYTTNATFQVFTSTKNQVPSP